MLSDNSRIAVIIPAYKVTDHLPGVVARIGPEVSHIYVVDDACPHDSGARLMEQCSDPRVKVIRHEQNQGVGGAVMVIPPFLTVLRSSNAMQLWPAAVLG